MKRVAGVWNYGPMNAIYENTHTQSFTTYNARSRVY